MPLLPKQIIISRRPEHLLDNSSVIEICGYYVNSSREVPVINLRDPDGENLGVLLGWAVQSSTLLQNGDSLETRISPDGIPEISDELCGRYILLFKVGDGIRVCTDAGGLFPLVYSEKLDALASTTTAMELVAKQRQSEASGELLDILRLIGWIPFGLTTFEGVRRLLPNFYLDISSSVPVRFYAPDGIINPDTSASVNGVLDRLRANIGAIIRGNAGFVHLTGGWDSRMVLAAARPWASECVFETVAGRGTELDCHLAAGLASKYGLKHELLPFVSPRQEEMEDWQYRVGYCLTDAVSRLGPTARAYDRNYHCINGVCGEVARAYYWARGYSGTEKIQPDELLERLGIPESPLMLREADNWLSSLGERRPTQILDVAYIEQRLGCWAGPSVFGHKVAYPTLSPFNSRAIYRLALALPEDARINNRFARALVLQAWPELLRIPINRAEGISKLRFAKQELKYFARAIGAKELVTTMKGWKTRRLKLFRPVS